MAIDYVVYIHVYYTQSKYNYNYVYDSLDGSTSSNYYDYLYLIDAILKVLDRTACCPRFCSIFFINDLLQLEADSRGVSLGNLKFNSFNSFAYADDVTVFCASASGLQKLINICYTYSKKLNFNLSRRPSV